MQTYIIKRLLLIVPIIALVAVLTFLLLRLVPGDVLMAQIGQGGVYSPEKMAIMRAHLGLDDPLLVQLAKWLGGIAHGNFGRSLLTDKPTLTSFLSAARITVELGILAIVIGMVIAIPVGVLSASKQDTSLDYLARVIATIGISVPDFGLGPRLSSLPAYGGTMPCLSDTYHCSRQSSSRPQPVLRRRR
ncbi:MAG: ABC transporter permease [Dehalococcoidia bacterium]